MKPPRSPQPKILRWLVVDVVSFLGLNTYFATIVFVQNDAKGSWGAFAAHFVEYLPHWIVWAAIAPVLFVVCRRMRLGIGRGFAPLAGHLCLSVLTTVTYLLVLRLGHALLLGSPLTSLIDDSTANLIEYQWYWWIVLAAHAYWGTTEAIARARQTGQLEAEAAKLSSRLVQAELATLKAQLHPHFLFNTHHAIAGLIRAQRHEAALDLIAHLSEFLRYTLENKGQRMVPFVREIEFVRKYLDIQQVRFGDRLQVEWELSGECAHIQIPPLLLQPLVENAVHHGISPRNANNVVKVRAQCTAHRLRVEIFNSRSSYTDEHVGFGLGLQNTHERLRRMYGTNYDLDLELVGRDQMGLTMSLPLDPPPHH